MSTAASSEGGYAEFEVLLTIALNVLGYEEVLKAGWFDVLRLEMLYEIEKNWNCTFELAIKALVQNLCGMTNPLFHLHLGKARTMNK